MAKIKNILVPNTWNKLNEWQLEQIAHLYLNADPDNFSSTYEQMILLCYQNSSGWKDFSKFKKIVREVPITELEKYVRFLRDSTEFYKFPDIPGLIKPSNRIENITIRQFSTIDTFFHIWNKDKSLLNLKRLVATLYRINDKYDDLDLVEVSKITDKISVEKLEAIALAFLFTRMYIEDKFPIVFPKKKDTEEEKLKPVFKKQNQSFIPFDKVIVGIAMDELQPLGKKQDADQVRVYEFLGVLSETILYHKTKAEAYARN
ncbi:hypothetical protein [Chishuiella sp.]|uniref:hypothetical protein n=1 Tax=Chishuiella sp. TaxID=1969467 RepID=UPI0028B24C5F|nr:hypothetical protein [Chishuiella sp.]